MMGRASSYSLNRREYGIRGNSGIRHYSALIPRYNENKEPENRKGGVLRLGIYALRGGYAWDTWIGWLVYAGTRNRIDFAVIPGIRPFGTLRIWNKKGIRNKKNKE